MLILTSLMVTLVVFGVAQSALSLKLIRQLNALRQMEARVEHFNDALALLTEATESGFRSTADELQRVAAVQRLSRDSSEVQHRLERAAASGGSVAQIAGQEGLSEGEVQLRLHIAKMTDLAAGQENSLGAM